MKNFLLIFSACMLLSTTSAQELELSFTGVVEQFHIQLDSIKVMNRTQGGDTVLVYPDTVLSLTIGGISPTEGLRSSLSLSKNSPNPFARQTSFRVFLPVKDKLHLRVTDLAGRTLVEYHSVLSVGEHDYMLKGGESGFYIVTASTSYGTKSIKISCLGLGSKRMRLDKIYKQGHKSSYDGAEIKNFFPFTIGDQLLFIGYVNTFTGVLESGIINASEESKAFTFQFATNIPCPGMPTVDYEGQVYNTIQIFSQCWLKENLNIGTMIQVNENMTDDNIIEKYCYSNRPDSCTKYGGLYQWNEMMQYTTLQGTQGICPPGWHLPTDEEWKILEGAVDSQYGIGNPAWEGTDYRGNDAGKNLRAASGWNSNGNGTDLFGFSGLPGGGRFANNTFYDIGSYGIWWTSSEFDQLFTWIRYLFSNSPKVQRDNYKKVNGFSVRCIKD